MMEFKMMQFIIQTHFQFIVVIANPDNWKTLDGFMMEFPLPN